MDGGQSGLGHRLQRDGSGRRQKGSGGQSGELIAPGAKIYTGDFVDKFIIPNFHVVLIHFPIAMLAAGVAIELFSFLWRRSSFREAGQWMILIGTLSAVPALTTGLYAFQDVMGHGHGADSMVEFKAASGFNQTDWNFVRQHIILNSAATVLSLFAVVMWLGASDRWRKLLGIPALLMLIISLFLMVGGAWHGGEMVSRLG